MELDEIDRRILCVLQGDATLSLDALSERVHLSRNAVWRRLKRLEPAVRARVAVLDPAALGLGLSAFVMIRAASHTPDWRERFARAVRAMPEVMGAHRTAGDLDYLLRVRLRDVTDYDRFYKELTARVPLADVSASFVTEDIVDRTALPL